MFQSRVHLGFAIDRFVAEEQGVSIMLHLGMPHAMEKQGAIEALDRFDS